MNILKYVARGLIALVFLYSGYQKLSVPLANFEEILRMYEIFPEFSIGLLSWSVPVAEILLGASIIFGLFKPLNYLASTAFFATFIIVLSRTLILQIPLDDCGCFGEGISLPLWGTLLIDIGLFLLSAWLLFSPAKRSER